MKAEASLFKVQGIMGTAADPGIENLDTDLLVLLTATNSVTGPAMEKIDRGLNGLLFKALGAADFKGHEREKVLFKCPEGSPTGFILVLGIGEHRKFTGCIMCHLFGIILDTAAQIAASDLTIAIQPNRQTADNVTLKGLAAIMRCRLHQYGLNHREQTLPQIRLFCTPQADRHLMSGLQVEPWICRPCPLNDEMPKNNRSLHVLDS